MRSVEDILLQLIPQGDSFTYHRAASRPFAAPLHIASCCPNHDYHHAVHATHDLLHHFAVQCSYHHAALTILLYISLSCLLWLAA